MRGKRRIIASLLWCLIMLGVAIATYPSGVLYTKVFWLWLTWNIAGTILGANVLLGEEQAEFFCQFTVTNFKKAPIFAILLIPFSISTICLIYTGIRDFLLINLFK